MILENAIDQHGYARLILCDAHGEYPIPVPKTQGHTRVSVIYNAFEVQELRERLGRKNEDFEPFIGLDHAYNGYYDPNMDVWLIQGSVRDLTTIYHHFAMLLEEGPTGSDDDCYDYWPNAMDMLMVFARDMAELTGDKGPWGDYLLTAMHKTIANRGDDEEWNILWDDIRDFTGTHPE
jgi:hypothetical protein